MFYVNLTDMKDDADLRARSARLSRRHSGASHADRDRAGADRPAEVPASLGSRYTAYTEGWGLYSELTPKEIGLYQDPYSDFGRLALELWRAGRLVVDTGIHTKRWTRAAGDRLSDQEYAERRGGLRRFDQSLHRLPSQATAYKIGMIKILELREKAKKQLGAKFDLRQFHDVVLTNGPVPLDMLEELVDRWVKAKS